MTTLSFELCSPQDKKGKQKGKIISCDIMVYNEEKQFVITWQINGSEFKDKFRLWEKSDVKRKYAGKKLSNLCKAIGVRFPAPTPDGRVEFDASVLKGKELFVFLEDFTSNRGEVFSYIKDYAPKPKDDFEDDTIF